MKNLISMFFRASRLLVDIKALSSMNPMRIIKRLLNKQIGSKVVRRLYIR